MQKGVLPLFLLFFVMIFSACTTSKTAKRESLVLKVLSYNIHHANPPSKSKEGLIDLKAIAKVIQESGADLVGLQEVDVHTIRSGKESHQAKELAKLTNMHYHFVKGIDFEGGEYGVAILSKFPFVEKDSLRLPMKEGIGGEPRVLSIVTVEPVKGALISFANTHLDLKPQNRHLQVEAIAQRFKSSRNPVILVGDFNSKPESDEIKNLERIFYRSRIENGFTYPERNPRTEIDYIMFKPKEKFHILQHKVLEEDYASDHRPLFVELEVKL